MEVQAAGPGIDLPGLLKALAVLAAGTLALRWGLLAARRRGVFTTVFWQTFWQFAPYRGKRLLSLAVIGAGAFLFIWGAALVYWWVRAYYAARLGHPGP